MEIQRRPRTATYRQIFITAAGTDQIKTYRGWTFPDHPPCIPKMYLLRSRHYRDIAVNIPVREAVSKFLLSPITTRFLHSL